jgi:hypothetical protein
VASLKNKKTEKTTPCIIALAACGRVMGAKPSAIHPGFGQ